MTQKLEEAQRDNAALKSQNDQFKGKIMLSSALLSPASAAAEAAKEQERERERRERRGSDDDDDDSSPAASPAVAVRQEAYIRMPLRKLNVIRREIDNQERIIQGFQSENERLTLRLKEQAKKHEDETRELRATNLKLETRVGGLMNQLERRTDEEHTMGAFTHAKVCFAPILLGFTYAWCLRFV